MSSKKKAAPARKTATNRQLTQMDPDLIYFTHARVRPVFTGCNKRIMETFDEVVAGTTSLADIPYITVIENFEAASSSVSGAGGGGKGKGKGKSGGGGGGGDDFGAKGKGKGKKGKRRGDDSESDDDAPTPTTRGSGASASAGPGGGEPFYFSLNNRRLFLFKALKAKGIINTVPVQVKPALERERERYTRERCALRAKLMGAGQRPVGEEAGSGDDEGSGGEGEEDE